MDALDAGHQKETREDSQTKTDDQRFSTIADVLNYLAAGWRVTKPSLYRHQKQGKIQPQPDGTYSQNDIDRYARTWLKQKSTGKKVSQRMDELQRKKLEQELQILTLDYERKKFQNEKDTKNFIPREQMDIELAARAGILDEGLKHWVQSRAADWIRTADGDTKKVGGLINLMNRDLDEHINSYASTREYQVVFESNEEVEQQESLPNGDSLGLK